MAEAVAPEAPKTGPKPDARWLWAVLALGLVVRVVWLLVVDTQPVTDFDWYFERAASLARGDGYAIDGQPTAYWPVGYPFFLSLVFKLTGPSVLAGKVLNTLLTLGCVALAWRVAHRLFRSAVVATCTALLLAVHPSFVVYSGILASEPLFTFLSLLAVALCLLGPRDSLKVMMAAGLVFGLATLVRPQAVLIPAVVVLCARTFDARDVFQGRTTKTLLVVYLCLFATLVPWTVRNFRVFVAPVFVSTNGGDNLLIGNSPKSTGLYLNPDSLGYDLSQLSEVDRDRRASSHAKRYIANNMGRVVSLWPTKLRGTFLTGTDAAYWAFQKSKGRLTPPGLGADKALYKRFRDYSQAWTVALAATAGLGIVLGALRRQSPATSLALIAYAAVLSLVFFGNPRFAFSVVPFMVMHACHGLVLLAGPVTRKPVLPEAPGELV